MTRDRQVEKGQTRDEKLAAALRRNLARRKAQGRARREVGVEDNQATQVMADVNGKPDEG